MWAEAATWIAKFPDVVLTGLDADGYPFSIRQSGSAYDARTGTLRVAPPDALRPAAGPANLLAHRHDESLRILGSIQIRGTLDRRDGDWVFVSSAFTPPPRFGTWALSRRMRATARRYLAKRGLDTPAVNWAAIAEIWEHVRARQST